MSDLSKVRWLMLLALAPLVASSIGCGSAYDASVSGVVKLDGNLVTRGTISYQPTQSGPAAYARINEDGSYVVRTGRESGLPAGEYAVTIISNEPAQSKDIGAPPPAGKAITPPWYRTKNTSGLKYTITPGKNEINLDLTSTPPPGYKVTKQR